MKQSKGVGTGNDEGNEDLIMTSESHVISNNLVSKIHKAEPIQDVVFSLKMTGDSEHKDNDSIKSLLPVEIHDK